MKKPSVHDFDAHGRATINVEHLEEQLAEAHAENERLKRIVLLQQKRWRQFNPEEPKKPTLH